LIYDRRVGEYILPAGSGVIGAGNRAQDAAILKPMSSALVNRMLRVHLKVSAADWLAWAHDWRRTFGVVLDTSGSSGPLAAGQGARRDRELRRRARRVSGAAGVLRRAGVRRRLRPDRGDRDARAREGPRRHDPANGASTCCKRHARVFPKDGPILVITDGYCDVFAIRRDHAVLMPEQARLPFTPRGPIFRIR
jgi:hypothetical protein